MVRIGRGCRVVYAGRVGVLDGKTELSKTTWWTVRWNRGGWGLVEESKLTLVYGPARRPVERTGLNAIRLKED